MQNKFPHISVNGCLFHFCQANWRKVQEYGLQKLYSEDLAFNEAVRSMSALAFLPAEDVREAFELLKPNLPDETEHLIHYFERTWVGMWKLEAEQEDTGRPTRRLLKWKAPLFSPQVWSAYERILEGEPATTNHLEGWHNRFMNIVSKKHPGMWPFLIDLLHEQSNTELRVEQLLAGQPPVRPRKSVRDAHSRVQSVVAKYNFSHVLQYLRGCAHNIKY